ncbi:MAG: glycogen debranching enzyme family protein [Bryobacterales bacterium]|nr:glycogen debranching enzyme family protein [Bryobacterales bacterium]
MAPMMEREWLETNGRGGFAMGTVAGINTRRYHGVLVASLRPPVERQVLLARVEEEVHGVNLGAAQYPGVVTPRGFEHLVHFQLAPFPTWRYQASGVTFTKRLFLRYGHQTAVLRYEAGAACRMRLRTFLACRDYHSLRRGGGDFDAGPLRVHTNALRFVADAHWYWRNQYAVEQARGLDFEEDLYSPGWYEFELTPGQGAWMVATIEDGTPDVEAWEREECARRAAFGSRLETAAEQFCVRRADGSPTILAGYPWFTDWGRDTMISIPGLLLARGKAAEARQILDGFLRHLNQGLIPNRFPDAGEEPEYNTADATLWAFVVAWALRCRRGSEQWLRDMFYPAALEILRWHMRGTHYGIRQDATDGLLWAGNAGTQLTWMDAKVGDWVVTPRHGKAVEINALWYNALRITAHWAGRYGDADMALRLSAEANRTMRSFAAKFWNPSRGCLYDRADPQDDRVRPNQLFAISLPFPLLDNERQRRVVELCERELLTPVGLRTLEPGHAEYRGRYEGGPWERDGAYHQGTVWPWLLGPFLSARLRAFGRTPENLAWCREQLRAMEAEIDQNCLGQLAEIYDGDEPRRAVGAAAQAWSVAEVLRIHAELVSAPVAPAVHP